MTFVARKPVGGTDRTAVGPPTVLKIANIIADIREALISYLGRFSLSLLPKIGNKTRPTALAENTTDKPRQFVSSSLRTPFGLQVDIKNVSNQNHSAVSIRATGCHSANVNEGVQSRKRHRYRLLPSLATSYLWYDIRSPTYTTDMEIEIDEGAINQRYPALLSFYRAWRESYEEAFMQQEIHLGSPCACVPWSGRASRVGGRGIFNCMLVSAPR